MNSSDGFEFVRICNSFDDCDYIYGGTDFVITDEDIELLKSGKIINFSVNDEYGCTLSYMPEGNKQILNAIGQVIDEMILSKRSYNRKFEDLKKKRRQHD